MRGDGGEVYVPYVLQLVYTDDVRPRTGASVVYKVCTSMY